MDWNEVKAKPKKQKKTKSSEDDGFYGGNQGGSLKAGPVKQSFGGPTKQATSHSASVVADFDPLANDFDEEIKYEKISLDCARAVQKARLEKEWSQAQLAKAVNEKTGLINDIEAGTAVYNADTINRIEKALGVSIPRGRANKKRKNKPAQF